MKSLNEMTDDAIEKYVKEEKLKGTKMSKKDGFWIRLWMDRERSSKIEETYEYLSREDGYDEKDEDSLKSVAEHWAQYDNRGYGSEYYRYGFQVVPKPPREWLEKGLIRLRKEQESLTIQENLIESELEN